MAAIKRILTLGTPVGLQMLVEVSAFATASVLSGKIGQIAAAGNQIALTLASTSFMIPLGISAATAVRVGQAVGAGDRAGARLAGQCGYILAVGSMAVAALAFNLFPEALARLTTDKEEVIRAAVPLVQIAALFQLFGARARCAASATPRPPSTPTSSATFSSGCRSRWGWLSAGRWEARVCGGGYRPG